MGSAPQVIGANDSVVPFLGSISAPLFIDSAETGERFALVEHPMPPRAPSPMHRPYCEDEFSFVREGTIGALL
jgi:hypothetical protein